MWFFFFCCFLWIVPAYSAIDASPLASLPAAYKGRFRPADSYARLWLYDIYHRQSLAQADLKAFHTSSRSALDLLWQLHFLGPEPWEKAPLFWMGKRDRISIEVIDNERLNQLKELLKQSFQLLPDLHDPALWHSLRALKTEQGGNFTAYDEATFATLRSHYLALEKAFHAHDEPLINLTTAQLAATLQKAYPPLAGTPYREAYGKSLSFPTFWQLTAEKLYYQLPLIEVSLYLYGAAACLALLHLLHPSQLISRSLLSLFSLAFLVHTLLLAVRCYITMRPPVSNMFETMLYVPWVAALASLIWCKVDWCLLAASLTSIALLALLKVTHLDSSLENVQAVLDSQYWLIVHVLLVVGSYGLFALCGLLGHGYLISYFYYSRETASMASLARTLLQGMYLGLGLLIPGTILGGIWAAESWGRFWDWDPKESWAFISSCVYLLWIHAQRFRLIENFGLAVGAIVGLQTISFTWYGVNYILGTGLHSYGFGSGGELYYYLFLAMEGLFLASVLVVQRKIYKVTG
jgi:ABC-type transport system involved in cytochrome c biogenesis permease subunit